METNETKQEQTEEKVTAAPETEAQKEAETVQKTEETETVADSSKETSAEAGKELTEEEKMALQIADMQKKIDDLTAENADLKDQVLRRAADFDNYRKRMLQENQDARDYGMAGLLKDLLDSLDNFDRTVEAAATATDPKTIADGVTMINKSMVSMLENKYNLVAYGAAGDAFDPDIHEAIGMQEGDVTEEQLAAVYLKGYKLKNRVIRHAKVMVVKPKA